ncbi:MAG: GH25 family lysozyme, partial [Faecousia sp.]
MNANKLKKAVSLLLVLVMVACMLPTITLTSSATGYDNGYSGGMAGVGYTVARGLDLSYWQRGINFSSIKSAGYDFVILRCGYSGTKDSCFETFYSQAKAAGLDVGVYFYSYATSAAGALQDAKECVSYLTGKQFEYPIYYDVEDPDRQGSLSTSTLQSICLTFMDYLAGQGYLTGLYASESWINSKIYAAQICTKYECWIAKYYLDYSENHSNGFPSKYGMWQYTDRCPVAGYNVDGDLCYKDYPTIVKTYGFNGYGASGSAKLTDPVVFNA